jgi:tungstate transport system permease protein
LNVKREKGLDFILEGLKEAFFLLLRLDPETISAIIITIKSSTLSIVFSLLIGFPLGFILGFFEFPFRRPLKLLSDTLLAIPTVVVGLILYAFISHRGPFGEYELLYTMEGIVIGQTLLALPIIISLTATTIEGMEKKLSLTLASFGLTMSQMIQSVVWELRHALLAVVVTAYGRIVAEVGIAMMIGGNIKWFTRTITTAISLETSKGEFSMGIALGLVLISIAFLANLSLYKLKKRSRER